MKHVHFIGIGGTGLSAIARVLLESGYTVSGSDRAYSPLAESVEQAGARLFVGHRAENVNGAEVVVRSSAVPDENVEVQAALSKGVPVLKRADFLGQFMTNYQTIAVAGTHGKTSTTALIAWMLTELKQDPSYIVGGVIQGLQTNAHAGKGSIFVIEADEYDRMFLGLRPAIAIVTNVVRVVLLSAVSEIYGPQHAQGFIHDASGFMVFAVAFILLFVVAKLIE